MKISSKGRYALRLMMDLAMCDKNTNISLKDISERQGISLKYLEQIISKLNKAGFVKSERGANGGYKLTKAPEEYTVGSILRLTEGSLSVTVCTEVEQNECERYGLCPTVKLWKDLNSAISNVVDNVTLADLINDSNISCKR